MKKTESRAHKKFNNLAYVRAIEMYEGLLEKGYFTDSLIRNLAISYLKIADYKKAEDKFRVLIDSSKFEPSDLYYYVQALKYNKKYEEADIWIEKYDAVDSGDPRAKEQKKNAEFVRKLMSIERYQISLLPFNSENADFGAVFYDGKILFSSSRRDQAVIRFEDAWKQLPYLALYFVNGDSASVIGAKFFTRKFNTVYNDGPACFNKAGDEIFVTRNNYRYHIPRKGKEGINNLKILYSHKNPIGTWSVPVELPFNNNDYSCGHPSLSADGKTLYFTSNMPGGYGGTDIYYVTRTDSGWSVPINLGADINTPGEEMFPFIHESGLLYFASNGIQGLGGLDLFVARKNKQAHFMVKNMGYPINSSSDDFAFYLKTDNKNGYFSTNRADGKGDDDIYAVQVLNPIGFDIVLAGNVSDSVTGEKITSSDVNLMTSSEEVLDKQNTKNSNVFMFPLDVNGNYSLQVEKEGYDKKLVPVEPVLFANANDTVFVPIKLHKRIEYGIYGNIFLKGTHDIIADVMVKIFDGSGKEFITTEKKGIDEFRVKLEPESDYQVLFSKPQFLSKRVYYSTKGRSPGYVNINEFIDIEVQKLELGAIVEIPNIYYDLAKWNIRPDAAKELEKVVQFLNDNPTIKVELGSHTDARGSDKANLILSQKRAQSAVEFIVKNGIDPKRITAKGYGEIRLKNKCGNGVNCTEEEHQQNRRTEIVVVGF